MTTPVLPYYPVTNYQCNDASKINLNYARIIDIVSDGTYDLTVNSLTVGTGDNTCEIQSDGDLIFNGDSVYLSDANKYVFKYTGVDRSPGDTKNINGIYFDSTIGIEILDNNGDPRLTVAGNGEIRIGDNDGTEYVSINSSGQIIFNNANMLRVKGDAYAFKYNTTNLATPQTKDGAGLYFETTSPITNSEIQFLGSAGTIILKVPISTNKFTDILSYLKISNIKSGATQAGAGAAANEVWKTASHASLPDNVLLIGV